MNKFFGLDCGGDAKTINMCSDGTPHVVVVATAQGKMMEMPKALFCRSSISQDFADFSCQSARGEWL
jgi:hypothetical protein